MPSHEDMTMTNTPIHVTVQFDNNNCMRLTGCDNSNSIVPRPNSPLTQSDPREMQNTARHITTTGSSNIIDTRPT